MEVLPLTYHRAPREVRGQVVPPEKLMTIPSRPRHFDSVVSDSSPFETAVHPVVLITGASRRVGRATALEFARLGCGLVLTYRETQAECEETAELARAAARACGGSITVRCARLDLADLDAVDRFSLEILAECSIDAIVHNASTYRATPFGTIRASDLEEMHRVEVVGPLLLTQSLRVMLERSSLAGGGAVVFYSDIYALGKPRAGFAAYILAKATVQTLAEQLAVELAPSVRVHCVAPGVVMWPEGFPEETKAAILARTPLGRAGTAEDAAKLVRFLVLEAPFMTGATIRLDGGRSLR